MGIQLKIFKVADEDEKILAASGEVRTEDAVAWLTENFSGASLANQQNGLVELIEPDRLVISLLRYKPYVYYSRHVIDGLAETGDVDPEEGNWWHYEFTSDGIDYTQFSLKLLYVLRTYMLAYGQDHPNVFGGAGFWLGMPGGRRMV